MELSPYLTKASIIDAVWEARADEHEAQLRQVRLGLQWALRHPVAVDADGVVGDYAGWGEPGRLGTSTPLVPLAGPGAPPVAAEAPIELAAAMGRPAMHAQQLIADALELVFRLPRLWTLVQEQVVPVWLARQISRETHDLSLDAALHADRLICAVPDKIGAVDARRLVHEARLRADPDRGAAEEEEALARRGVWLRRDKAAPATTEVSMVLDTADANLFDQTVSRVAAELRGLGDTDGREVRRAKAVGVLADPQHALDLLSGRDDAAPSTGGTGTMDLVVHLTDTDTDPDLADTEQAGESGGVAVVEGLGAVTMRLLEAWLARHRGAGGRVTLRPVIDLTRTRAGTRAVDAHDPPPQMAEQVVLRDAHCVFPGCRRDSRACDLDHIDPYVPLDQGGPPGQTTAGNLAPLCRRHHNAKTHGGWNYHRRPDGSYDWTSPTGHDYDVVPHSRRPMDARRA